MNTFIDIDFRYKKRVILLQAFKFIVAGILNTATDLLILNALILSFDHNFSSTTYAVFKTISFLAALTLSFFLNKYWVFKKSRLNSRRGEKTLFVFVSVMAFLINVLIASFVFTVLNRANIVGVAVAANVGALVGTITVLVWNFVCYKFLVFKS